MRPLDRAILAVLALGIWALAAIQLVGPLGGPPDALAQGREIDMPQPVTGSGVAPDVPRAREIRGQLRDAISGCRVEGEVTGARWSGTIRC